MPKHLIIVLLLFCIAGGHSQQAPLPPDLRQYNLTQYNSSLFNPVFSLDRNNPQSLSLWVRWQWQQIDADPTTLFANYSHMLNKHSAFGVGFLQQNTGVFLQTGGFLNYAYALDLGPKIKLTLGLNVFGFRQELADDRFQQSPITGLPILNNSSSLVLQAAPGIGFIYGDFTLGLASENVLEYNFTEGGKNYGSDEKIYMGSLSYNFPIIGEGVFDQAQVRPIFYIKRIPGLDTQIGLQSLFLTKNYWLQAGYHNFYGLSGGLGFTLMQKLSFGILVEVGNSQELTGKDPTFELITSYKFKEPDLRRKIVGFDLEEEETLVQEAEQKKKLSRKEREAQAQIDEGKRQDSVMNSIRRQDSLSLARQKTADQEKARQASEAQRKKDSLESKLAIKAENAKKEEMVVPQEGERIEEAVLTRDIEPGFYLIVNAFGTQGYLDLFLKSLSEKGLNPKSFYRVQRKLNYVYLERYNSIQEARKARDSKFFGKYMDTIWIFRVKEE